MGYWTDWYQPPDISNHTVPAYNARNVFEYRYYNARSLNDFLAEDTCLFNIETGTNGNYYAAPGLMNSAERQSYAAYGTKSGTYVFEGPVQGNGEGMDNPMYDAAAWAYVRNGQVQLYDEPNPWHHQSDAYFDFFPEVVDIGGVYVSSPTGGQWPGRNTGFYEREQSQGVLSYTTFNQTRKANSFGYYAFLQMTAHQNLSLLRFRDILGFAKYGSLRIGLNSNRAVSSLGSSLPDFYTDYEFGGSKPNNPDGTPVYTGNGSAGTLLDVSMRLIVAGPYPGTADAFGGDGSFAERVGYQAVAVNPAYRDNTFSFGAYETQYSDPPIQNTFPARNNWIAFYDDYVGYPYAPRGRAAMSWINPATGTPLSTVVPPTGFYDTTTNRPIMNAGGYQSWSPSMLTSDLKVPFLVTDSYQRLGTVPTTPFLDPAHVFYGGGYFTTTTNAQFFLVGLKYTVRPPVVRFYVEDFATTPTQTVTPPLRHGQRASASISAKTTLRHGADSNR